MGPLVASLVMLASVVLSANWPVVLDKIETKVLRLEMAQPQSTTPGMCSGVVLNTKAGFLLTAAHCVDDDNIELTVGGRHAEVAKKNRVLDLAVIRFSPRPEHQVVRLALDVPKMGDEVAIVGFPTFWDKELHSQFGHVSRQSAEGEMAVDGTVIPGNSGGALLNANGELVGINVAVQYAVGGASHMCVSVPLETLRDFVLEYLPKE